MFNSNDCALFCEGSRLNGVCSFLVDLTRFRPVGASEAKEVTLILTVVECVECGWRGLGALELLWMHFKSLADFAVVVIVCVCL
mmetsp:Transcript_906/g.1356  ORF Transcript_906/g.1356 Transcript_906/m.1356 type:complete len:84 (-) Transcript_906:30-281(-)